MTSLAYWLKNLKLSPTVADSVHTTDAAKLNGFVGGVNWTLQMNGCSTSYAHTRGVGSPTRRPDVDVTHGAWPAWPESCSPV